MAEYSGDFGRIKGRGGFLKQTLTRSKAAFHKADLLGLSTAMVSPNWAMREPSAYSYCYSPRMAVCHICGAENPEGASYCGHCGARLTGAELPPPLAGTGPPPYVPPVPPPPHVPPPPQFVPPPGTP